MRNYLLAVLSVLLAEGMASAAAAAPPKEVGFVEDSGRTRDSAVAAIEMERALQAGAGWIRITATWVPTQVEAYNDIEAVCNAVREANARGIKVLLNLIPVWGEDKRFPQRSGAQNTFATLAGHYVQQLATNPLCQPDQDAIYIEILNEPNNPVFLKQQFYPDGTSAAPRLAVRTLAAAYDAIKRKGRELGVDTVVIGPGLAASGNDNPRSSRPSHSPTLFIRKMGEAYREMRRKRRIFDAFSHHPYGDESSQAPSFTHPFSTTISLADYNKLRAELGRAFDGTGQKGTDVPIWYTEYGFETVVDAPKSNYYINGPQPASIRAIDEAIQAGYIRQALQLAACQPTVEALLFFHVKDERNLTDGWQSGSFYADGSPKSSLPAIRQAVMDARSGAIASCG